MVEFPVRKPRNIDSFVGVVVWAWNHDHRADVYIQYDAILEPFESFIGTIDISGVFYDFLKRFSSKKSSEFYNDTNRYYIVKFKTLLAGYQLFKRGIEEFENVLKAAEDEDEFCIMAGNS